MKRSTPMARRRVATVAVTFLCFALLLPASAPAQGPFTGAIFTTEMACDGTNVNIFASKDAVYLDGGPAHPGAAGLPDGEYYVRVTEPDGTLLGTTVDHPTDETPAVVVDGEFVECYQLSAILIRASDSLPGYDTTSNMGGEYKVEISPNEDFSPRKSDNFKVEIGDDPGGEPETGELCVVKFYDANVNGINDDGQELDGWKVVIADGITYTRFTPVSIMLDPDDYTVTECAPNEPNWVATTPTSVPVTLEADEKETVEFGNVCLGGGGGHTLGYWSNKNGKATLNDAPCMGSNCMASELALLSSLCLRTAGGGDFDPTSYTELRTWLLEGNAVNMAYMLSVQLAAMQLNVEAGFVDGGALVYAPGVPGASMLGFISIDDLIAQANMALCADGDTPDGDANRATQEALKDALDAANNNQNFVQSTPCPFSFPLDTE